ncbi:MAG: sensor histidine kinase, partial [Chloroflexi bacterium]|nr:sensor histidine kinase [Chloroflexota bacterium]
DLVVEDYVAEEGITHPVDSVVVGEGLKSFLAVPLRMGEKVFGALYVANRTPHRFSSHDGNLLSRLANQAAIAIENAQLYDQVQSLAVLEERDRIAREMHDGLAQVLGYLNLKTKTVQSMLPRGKVEQAQVELVDMEKVIQDAYADVRESIFGLRTSVASTLEFIPTLAEYCRKFSQQSNLSTTLDPDGLVDMRLSPAAEVQLVRIIQEALANVRKHAKATNACVKFQPCQDMVSIVVEDNGQGFDLREAQRKEGQHFGLQTMRERAESVGGTLDIDSTPGKGTSVIVKLPVEGEGG